MTSDVICGASGSGQRPNEPQAALLIRKDSNDMSAAFKLLIDALEHIRIFKMFVMLSG